MAACMQADWVIHKNFSSYKDVKDFISCEETSTNTRYVTVRSEKNFPKDSTSLEGHQVKEAVRSHKIFYQGSQQQACISLGILNMECTNGPEHHRKAKIRYQQKKTGMEHNYTEKKCKRVLQNSKKHGCEAKISITAMLVFPDFKVPECGNKKYNHTTTSKKLKAFCMDPQNEVPNNILEYTLRMNNNHTNHLFGELGGQALNIDSRISEKIVSFVKDRVRSVSEMKRHLKIFVEKELNIETQQNNRRFYPVDTVIRNHTYRAIVKLQFSGDDQENLSRKISQWKEAFPLDNFFFQPVYEGSEDRFIFVHQTSWQKRLLNMYGQKICLLDATYKTSTYDCSLFFVCVQSNVGYIVVGSFLLADESADSICEGLKKLREWNPGWCPDNFLTDFDEREIQAIEKTFEGCFVMLCDFHREQAWSRWLRNIKNGLDKVKDKVLPLLRNIAYSNTEEQYANNVEVLQNSDFWGKLKNWFAIKWLASDKRWVRAFRPHLKIHTTNGVERQHRTFKHSYLGSHSHGTLTSLVEVLVEKFLPDSQNRYLQNNIASMEEYRMYSQEVPLFLRNRPRKFVRHCMDRLSPSTEQYTDGNFNILSATAVAVRSADSGIVYTVDISAPSCTCPDWHIHNLPCKHMLGVFTNLPAYGWDFLPAAYRDCLQFALDPFIVEEDIVPNTPGENEGESLERASVSNIRKCECELKTIQNLLYQASDTDVAHVLGDLLKLKETLQVTNKTLQPTLRKRKTFKPIKRRDKRVRLQVGETGNDVQLDGIPEMPEEFPADNEGEDDPPTNNLIDEGSAVSAQMPESMEWCKLEEFQEELDLILQDTSSSKVIRKIGPYTITNESFSFLQTTLSDEIIDAFLHVETKRHNGVLHVNTHVMTAICDGIPDIPDALHKV